MQRLFEDLPRALRGLLRGPAFTLPAVLILAVAIGANTAIFTVVDAVVLRPLPLPDSRELVILCEEHASIEGYCVMSPPNAEDLGREARTLEGVGLVRDWPFAVGDAGESAAVRGGIATPAFFRLLGVELERGRAFAEDEVGPGRDRVVLLGHALWTTRFGADPSVVGSTVTVDGEPNTVVGVLPAGFEVPALEYVEMWKPLHIDPTDPERRSWRGFRAIGRLRDGVGLGEAATELAGLYANLERAHEEVGPDWRIRVLRLQDHLVEDVRATLLLFLAAVAVLLLIGCANVANLLLARGVRRRQQVAVRSALGAGKLDLARDVLLESSILATAGGAAGLLLGWWATGFFVAMAPPGIPRLDDVGMDLRALGFAAALSLVTVLVFGLLPALRQGRDGLAADLRHGRSSEDKGGRRLRQGLVVAELALSLVLLSAAGLLLRSFGRYLAWDPGFDREGVRAVSAFFPTSRYPTREALRAVFDVAEAELRAIPGVVGVGMASAGPLFGGIERTQFLPAGAEPEPGVDPPSARYVDAGPGYLETLGVRLLAGRTLLREDGPGAPPVVVVNETLARSAWPGESAVGKRLLLPEEDRTAEVVGVVADVRPLTPGESAEPEVYWSNRQETRWFPYFLIRTEGDAAGAAAAVRERLAAIDPEISVGTLRSMDDLVRQRLVRPRFTLWLVGAFALSALLLAAVGTYAVVAFTVAQRTRELGVRIALGSSRRRVVAGVLGEGVRLAAIGGVLGLAGAYAVSGLVGTVVRGVPADDPATLGGTALVLAVVTVVACLVPAVRASRVDPRVLLEEG